MTTYAEVAVEFGLELTPERGSLLRANGVSPEEFRSRCEAMKMLRQQMPLQHVRVRRALERMWADMAREDDDVMVVRGVLDSLDDDIHPDRDAALAALERLGERLY